MTKKVSLPIQDELLDCINPVLVLTDEGWDDFIDMIENPPEPTQELKNLFEKFKPKSFELDDLDKECFMTFESLTRELIDLETKIGMKLGLSGNIRSKLIELDKANLLDEDELVRDWHGVYSNWIDWNNSE